MRCLAAAYLLLMVIAGCGSTGSSSTSTASRLQHALALWQRFPATNEPRPILRLVGTNPDLPGAFTSQDAETAFYCGKFTSGSAGFSPDVPAGSHVTWKFGTTMSYPAISAEAAFGGLSSRRGPGSSSQSCQKVPPLVLTSARLSTAEFFTDRGPSEMSAYMFTMTDASGELAYPAVAPSAFWSGAGGVVSGGGVADVSDDGMSMTWGFAGAPPGQGHCHTDYKAAVVESSTTIAVAAVETPELPSDCSLEALAGKAVWRTLTISLQAPVGGRVVVDEDGAPAPVCPINRPAGLPVPC